MSQRDGLEIVADKFPSVSRWARYLGMVSLSGIFTPSAVMSVVKGDVPNLNRAKSKSRRIEAVQSPLESQGSAKYRRCSRARFG